MARRPPRPRPSPFDPDNPDFVGTNSNSPVRPVRPVSPTVGGGGSVGGPAGGPEPGEVTPPEFFPMIGRPIPVDPLEAILAANQAAIDGFNKSIADLSAANEASLASLKADQEKKFAEFEKRAANNEKRRADELAFRQKRQSGIAKKQATGSGDTPKVSILKDSLLGGGAGKTLLGA